jgi:hypothetical protein
MGAVKKNSDATELAFDRVTALMLAEEIDLPNGSVFVPADLPTFETIMDRHLAENRPIVVIYPDGSEQLVEPNGLSAQRL